MRTTVALDDGVYEAARAQALDARLRVHARKNGLVGIIKT
jgi:hypothetical protein